MPNKESTSGLQAICTTVASSTATILALLFTLAIAYKVFLDERKAQFAEHIEGEKVEIQRLLWDMRNNWRGFGRSGIVGGLAGSIFYLPLDFEEDYQARYPSKAGFDLTQQAMRDVIFADARMASITTSREPIYQGPWRGRVYLWVVWRIISAATVGDAYTEADAEHVLPRDAVLPGFDDWEVNFKNVVGWTAMLRAADWDLQQDLSNYVQKRPSNLKVVPPMASQSLARFYAQLDEIRSKLDGIHKDTVTLRRYDLGGPILSLSVLALLAMLYIAGVVLPLWLMARGQVTNLLVVLLVGLPLAFSILCCWRLIKETTLQLSFNESAFLEARWKSHIADDMRDSNERLDRGAPVNLSLAEEVLASPGETGPSAPVRASVSSYVRFGRAYNAACRSLSSWLIKEIESDRLFGGPAYYRVPASINMRSVGFTASEMLQDERKFESKLSELAESNAEWVFLEVEHPGGIGPALAVRADLNLRDPTAVRSTFRNLRNALLASPPAKEFDKTRADVRAAASRVQTLVKN